VTCLDIGIGFGSKTGLAAIYYGGEYWKQCIQSSSSAYSPCQINIKLTQYMPANLTISDMTVINRTGLQPYSSLGKN